MLTSVPTGPLLGLITTTVGAIAAVYVNWSAGAFIALVPPVADTWTSTGAVGLGEIAGAITLTTWLLNGWRRPVSAVPPNLTPVRPPRSVPLIRTLVPAGPVLGPMASTTGGGVVV